MSRQSDIRCIRCDESVRLHTADDAGDLDSLYHCPDCRAHAASWNLPVAIARAPWWRRLYWFLFGDELGLYCARCSARHGSLADATQHERVCQWCQDLEASLVDAEPTGKFSRPPPTSMPGPLEKRSG